MGTGTGRGRGGIGGRGFGVESTSGCLVMGGGVWFVVVWVCAVLYVPGLVEGRGLGYGWGGAWVYGWLGLALVGFGEHGPGSGEVYHG
jgi:hypothetical protein